MRTGPGCSFFSSGHYSPHCVPRRKSRVPSRSRVGVGRSLARRCGRGKTCGAPRSARRRLAPRKKRGRRRRGAGPGRLAVVKPNGGDEAKPGPGKAMVGASEGISRRCRKGEALQYCLATYCTTAAPDCRVLVLKISSLFFSHLCLFLFLLTTRAEGTGERKSDVTTAVHSWIIN